VQKKTNVWVFGSLFLCFAFIMGCAAVLPWSLIIDLPLALILGLIGWRTGRRNPSVFDVQIDNTGPWGGTGGTYSGWTGGGWSSSDWSGGSSFSGGSSSWGGFGGGSSGGGGASGGW